jgi:hypothetical protein
MDRKRPAGEPASLPEPYTPACNQLRSCTPSLHAQSQAGLLHQPPIRACSSGWTHVRRTCTPGSITGRLWTATRTTPTSQLLYLYADLLPNMYTILNCTLHWTAPVRRTELRMSADAEPVHRRASPRPSAELRPSAVVCRAPSGPCRRGSSHACPTRALRGVWLNLYAVRRRRGMQPSSLRRVPPVRRVPRRTCSPCFAWRLNLS